MLPQNRGLETSRALGGIAGDFPCPEGVTPHNKTLGSPDCPIAPWSQPDRV